MIPVVKISDLNKREREVRKLLNELEKQLKSKGISKDDYDRQKKEKEDELRKIEVDRKAIIEKLPPIPPPPKPTRGVIAARADSDINDIMVNLKKHEKDLNFTQAEVSKMFAEVVKNRERIRVVEDMAKKAVSDKPAAAAVDSKDMDSKISAKVDVITNQVKTNLQKNREDLDRMMGELRNLKMEIDGLKKTHSSLENMDVSGLRRDLESLKARSTHLEEQVASIDMETVYDLIKEIERKVALGGSGPVIIE